jgi:hypothetical protein
MTHGASAYVNHRCRCAVCTAANTARVREYRNRRTAAGTSGANGTTFGDNTNVPRRRANAPGPGSKEYPLKRFPDYPPSGGGAR